MWLALSQDKTVISNNVREDFNYFRDSKDNEEVKYVVKEAYQESWSEWHMLPNIIQAFILKVQKSQSIPQTLQIQMWNL